MNPRIVNSPTGIGWVLVEFWDGGKYVPGPAFRSVEEAERFINETNKKEN